MSSVTKEPLGESAQAGEERISCSVEVVDGKLEQRVVVDEQAYGATRPLPEAVVNPDDLAGQWWRSYLEGRPARPVKRRGSVRFVEMFAGSGGLALGFTEGSAQLGYRARSLAAVDLDGEALQVYKRRNSTRLVTAGSTTSIVSFDVEGQGAECTFRKDENGKVIAPKIIDPQWADLDNVDVLLAGPPCQGHSNLNNHTRYTDPRNRLYLTVPAVAIALQIPVVIIENVRGAVHDASEVVDSTEALLKAAGYVVERDVMKAAEIGWAQSRERFFMVARLGSAPVPFDEVVKALSHGVSEGRDVRWAIDDIAEEPEDEFMHSRAKMSDENLARIEYLFDKKAYELPDHERPDCHKDGTTYNAVYGRLYPDRPAPTITTGFMTMGRGRFTHYSQRRVLNPHEAARLQGYPDDYDFRLADGTIPPKSKLQKWIGDAVPMPLGYAATISALGPGIPRVGTEKSG